MGGVLLKKSSLFLILSLQEEQPKFNIELATAFSPEYHTWMNMKSNLCGLFAFKKKKIILMD